MRPRPAVIREDELTVYAGYAVLPAGPWPSGSAVKQRCASRQSQVWSLSGGVDGSDADRCVCAEGTLAVGQWFAVAEIDVQDGSEDNDVVAAVDQRLY
jgi:hypothetical protein